MDTEGNKSLNPTTIIDLTLDSDDETPEKTTTVLQPSQPVDPSFLSHTTRMGQFQSSHHGLNLKRPFVVSDKVTPSALSRPLPPKRDDLALLYTLPNQPPQFQKLPLTTNLLNNEENPAKRRRLINGRGINAVYRPDSTSRTEIGISERQASQDRKHEYYTGVKTKEFSTAIEASKAKPPVAGLPKAMTEKVFPQIDKYIVKYRGAIDESLLKKIPPKTAWALCRGPEFTSVVRETNGELTPEFEATLKKRIKNTVDKLAQSMLSKSFVKDKMNNHKKHQYPVLPASSEGSLDDSDSSLCSFPLLNGRKLKPARTSDDDSSLSPKSQTFASIKKGSNSSSSTSLTPDVINSTASCRNGSFRSQTHPLHLPQTGKRKKALRKRKSYDLSTLGRQKLVKWYNPEITPIQKRITDLNHQINDLRLAGLDHKTSRPYLSSSALDDIQKGINEVASSDESKNRAEVEASAIEGQLIHVDFSNEELCYIEATIGSVIKQPRNLNLGIAARIERLLNQNRAHVAEFLRVLSARKGNSSQKNRYLQNRTTEDIAAFFEDAMAGRISKRPQTIRFSMKPRPLRSSSRISSNISAILRGREVFENPRRFEQDLSIRTRILTYMEDTFSREAEWSDCSGDITTITCLPDDLFICGAITHSDLHNQQYNKPGNLLLGSADKRTLKSIPGHRIPRPIVLKGDNALPSMRQTQDPWLYSSVTCTAYDHISKYCFTGSFDHTVKIWNFSSNDSNANFDIQGTWPHDGVVNFVVTSPYHGKIATAADIVQNAIRVYTLDTLDVSASSFISYSGERADEQCLGRRDKPQTWAYYPATLHWGRAPTVAHLLLAGYSPRGFDPNIPDIPDDKVNTGELCLWDTNTRVRIPISAARTQNVFEVVWHPTQPIFIAATSAAGYLEDGVQTQLRLFGQAEHGMFTLLKTLDCPAFDINEVTIMPNSQLYAYVTASCTNGVTYVWDSAQDEHPIQILRHGQSIDDQTNEVSHEESDSGVKFAAWGQTMNRFYTGSSDGVVKAWNVRAPRGKAFVKNVISLSGGISCGVFSSDYSRLIIGDSTGKVHLLTQNIPDFEDEERAMIRQPITPHNGSGASISVANDMRTVEVSETCTAKDFSNVFVDNRQIILHPDPYIGAIQGPNYESTNLYCPELHQFENVSGPLIPEIQALQNSRYCQQQIKLSRLPKAEPCSEELHLENLDKDLDLGTIRPETIYPLLLERVDFKFRPDNNFDEEMIGWVFQGAQESGLMAESHFLSPNEIETFKDLSAQINREVQVFRNLETVTAQM